LPIVVGQTVGAAETTGSSGAVRKIDLVLPICTNINGRHDDIDRARRGLFPSLRRFDYPAFTNTVHIVCPARDRDEISGMLSDFFPEFRYSSSS
jgi:hypothetical protein